MISLESFGHSSLTPEGCSLRLPLALARDCAIAGGRRRTRSLIEGLAARTAPSRSARHRRTCLLAVYGGLCVREDGRLLCRRHAPREESSRKLISRGLGRGGSVLSVALLAASNRFESRDIAHPTASVAECCGSQGSASAVVLWEQPVRATAQSEASVVNHQHPGQHAAPKWAIDSARTV